MNNEAYANLAVEFDDDCFIHRFTFNNIEEDKEFFITNERGRWAEKMEYIFGNAPVMGQEILGWRNQALLVGSNIYLLSTHIWPKSDGKSHHELLTVCKKWENYVSTILNFPRPQRMNWVYTKSLTLSCTHSSLKW